MDNFEKNGFIKNEEVKKSGWYILSRTDDEESFTTVQVIEFKDHFYLVDPDGREMKTSKSPISTFDEECRWKLIWR